MARSWLYKYGENSIKVVNKNFDGSELYVNSELYDQRKCISLTETLTATLKSGETITATLGGTLTMKCTLCINGELQEPVEVK